MMCILPLKSILEELPPDDPAFQAALGQMEMESGNIASSEKIFQELIRREPENLDHIRSLVRVLMKGNCLAEAEKILLQATDTYSKNLILRFTLGTLFERKKDWFSAKNVFKTIVTLHPASAGSHLHLAYCLTQLDDWKTAQTHYYTACKISRPTKNWIKKYLSVCLVNNDFTSFDEFDEEERFKCYILHSHLHNKHIVKDFFSDLTSDYLDYHSELKKVFKEKLTTIFHNSCVAVGDLSSQRLNVYNSYRRTLHQPLQHDRRILLLGSSQVFGYFCEDRYTIASFLQNIYNISAMNIRVDQLGVPAMGISNVYLQLRSYLQDSDTVLFLYGSHPSMLVQDEHRNSIIMYLKAIHSVYPKINFIFFLLPRGC